MTMLTTQCIMVLDVPNKNGRTYTTKAMDEAIKAYGDKPLIGTLGMPNDFDGMTVSLEQASHLVSNLRIEDGKVICDIHVMKTPNGLILERMLAPDGVPMAFRTAGTAAMADDGTITDFKLITVAAIPESDAA